MTDAVTPFGAARPSFFFWSKIDSSQKYFLDVTTFSIIVTVLLPKRVEREETFLKKGARLNDLLFGYGRSFGARNLD